MRVKYWLGGAVLLAAEVVKRRAGAASLVRRLYLAAGLIIILGVLVPVVIPYSSMSGGYMAGDNLASLGHPGHPLQHPGLDPWGLDQSQSYLGHHHPGLDTNGHGGYPGDPAAAEYEARARLLASHNRCHY